MVERQKSLPRRELAAEFSQTSEHSQEQIERALSAFIDPANPRMSLDNFFNRLTRVAVGTGEKWTEEDRNVARELRGVLAEVRDARLFNDRYIGHLLSEASIPGMLGYMLAMRIGSNTVAEEVSIQETKREPEAIAALMEIVGYDPKVGSGTFTSGGSMANMTALAVARELMQERIGTKRRIKEEIKVLTSPFAHYSVSKVCNLLGGPGKQISVQGVETENLRIKPEALENDIAEAERRGIPIMAVVAIAGETETGLVDPLNDIADITEAHGVNLIVDGAYGAPYRLSRRGDLFRGMERAMAVTIDPHKALYTPYNNGAVLFKNAEDHARLNLGVKAPYIGFEAVDEEEDPLEFQQNLDELVASLRGERLGERNRSLGEKRIEGSMSAGPILSTLAVWRTLGRDGLATIYDLTLDRTLHLHDRINQSSYLEPKHEPEINLLCFALTQETKTQLGIEDKETLRGFINDTREELDNGIRGEGGYFFSATELPDDNGNTEWVYRACIMHPRTTDTIVDDAVSGLETIINQRIIGNR